MSEPSDGIRLDGWIHTVVHAKDGRRAFQAAVDAGWIEILPINGKPRSAFLMKRLTQGALTDTVRPPAPEGIDVFGGSDGLLVRNSPRTGSPCSNLSGSDRGLCGSADRRRLGPINSSSGGLPDTSAANDEEGNDDMESALSAAGVDR